MKTKSKVLFFFLLGLLVGSIASAQQERAEPGLPPPTRANVAYGAHPRHVFDYWKGKGDGPHPLLLCIHGGGFMTGDKSGYHRPGQILPYLEEGISVVTLNYRLTEGGKNPFPAPMLDGVRAIQFLRARAEEFNLDKTRFAATGGSAGACMLMWIGFHPDRADPESADPVERESSRLQVLAPVNGQTSLHVPTIISWFGVETLSEHRAFRPLFGLPEGETWPMTAELDCLMREASALTYLSADDPPVYLAYGPDIPIDAGSKPNEWVHHPMFGFQLKKLADPLGLECHVEVKGGPPVPGYASQREFIIRKLKGS